MNNLGGTIAPAILAPQNAEYIGRYNLLADRLGYATGTVANEYSAQTWRWDVKFKKPVVVNFNNATGGQVNSIINNSFHVIGNCEGGNVFLVYFSRVEYTDD